MSWRCSYGVLNCPICKRHEATIAEKQRSEKIVKRVQDGLTSGRIKIGFKNGKVTFVGADLEGADEECAYRAILVSGSALAKQAIFKAELLAGRGVDKRVIGQGAHSHDGGRTWHDRKG